MKAAGKQLGRHHGAMVLRWGEHQLHAWLLQGVELRAQGQQSAAGLEVTRSNRSSIGIVLVRERSAAGRWKPPRPATERPPRWKVHSAMS